MKMSQEEFDKLIQTKEIPKGFSKSDLLETGIDQVEKCMGQMVNIRVKQVA